MRKRFGTNEWRVLRLASELREGKREREMERGRGGAAGSSPRRGKSLTISISAYPAVIVPIDTLPSYR